MCISIDIQLYIDMYFILCSVIAKVWWTLWDETSDILVARSGWRERTFGLYVYHPQMFLYLFCDVYSVEIFEQQQQQQQQQGYRNNFQYFSVRMISHVEIVLHGCSWSHNWLRLFFILGSSYQQGWRWWTKVLSNENCNIPFDTQTDDSSNAGTRYEAYSASEFGA